MSCGQREEAQELEQRSPLRRVGAPLSAVTALSKGAPLSAVTALSKVTHPTPMTSLAAVRDEDELRAWGSRLAKQGVVNPEAVDWVVEPKVDGLAVRVVYRDGRLALAATRGDGTQGEDVTHNAATGAIQGLPLSLAGSSSSSSSNGNGNGGMLQLPSEVEVRGEVFMTTTDFEQLNAQQVAAGQAGFANPRNAAAGSLRLLDAGEAAGRRLSFRAYQLLLPQGTSGAPTSQAGCLAWLEQHGVTTTATRAAQGLDGHATWQGFEAAVAAAGRWMQQRERLDYDVDGVVLKVNDLDLQEEAGVDAGRDPRWAVAWKFPAKLATTRILGIEWSVGRSGVLTPVARLETVQIGGVNVSNASLHNVGQLRALGLVQGDMVTVKRAGDVIPQVVGCLLEARDPLTSTQEPFPEPTHCPSCTQPLTFVEPKTRNAKGHLWCSNPACPAQQLARMKHFVDVCVKGIGGATVEALWERGWLPNPAGLYKLTQADLMTLPAVKERKSAKMLAAIEASRAMPLKMLLAGLAIADVGERQAANLATKYKTMKRLQLAANGSAPSSSSSSSNTAAAADPEISGVLGASLAAWFADAHNKLLLNELRQAGVAVCQEDPAAAELVAEDGLSAATIDVPGSIPGISGPGQNDVEALSGVSVCVTGKCRRKVLESRYLQEGYIQEKGGEFHKAVKKTTTWLLVGDKPGQNKLEAAAKYGTRKLSEEEFFAEIEKLTLQKQGYM
ncbi:hypothetical protein OEZ86_003615 [Tetradesmus obliquus]|nr:hypothetical protein OEZ86_003615 [Tetradesmus obliquus]